jgi:hypothetical protein
MRMMSPMLNLAQTTDLLMYACSIMGEWLVLNLRVIKPFCCCCLAFKKQHYAVFIIYIYLKRVKILFLLIETRYIELVSNRCF